MFPGAYSLCLITLAANIFKKLHGVADCQLIEIMTCQIVTVKVQFLPVRCFDKTIIFRLKQVYSLALQYRRVQLGIAALTAGMIFQLPLGGIESISHGNIHIFIGYAIDHQFTAWHRHVNVHVKQPSLVVMLVWKLDDDPAAHDMGIKLSEFFRFFPDMAFQRFGVGDIPCGDL